MDDPIGLAGDRVRLVPPDRARHLENALRWMNDPAVTTTIALNFGVARGEEEAFGSPASSARGAGAPPR